MEIIQLHYLFANTLCVLNSLYCVLSLFSFFLLRHWCVSPKEPVKSWATEKVQYLSRECQFLSSELLRPHVEYWGHSAFKGDAGIVRGFPGGASGK